MDDSSLEELNRLANSTFLEAQTASGRDKIKLLKKAAFYAIDASLKDSIPSEYFEKYIEILNTASRVHTFPQEYQKHVVRMKKGLMYSGEKTRYEKVVNKKTGYLQVESGTLVLGDSGMELNFKDFSEKEMVEEIKKGKFFIFSTQSDGNFEVEVRILSGREPILTHEELRRVVGATETLKVNLHSGNLVFAALGEFPDGSSKIEMKIKPSVYKVCAYGLDIPNKFLGYIVVLSPTEEKSENDLNRLPELPVW